MGMPAPGGTPENDHNHRQASLAFDEYKMIAEDTAKITDRRQTINIMFTSTINVFLLSAIGYLLLLQFEASSGDWHSLFFAGGIYVVAIIASLLNNTWLRLSEQSRQLIDLRIRYLKALEVRLRESGYFPDVDTQLKDNEAPPPTLAGTEVTHPDGAGVMQRWMRTRGTYSIEDVFYGPRAKKEPFGFSRAEQRISAIFTWAYWLAFGISVVAIGIQVVVNLAHIHFNLGPYGF